jgi:hypothetical protein
MPFPITHCPRCQSALINPFPAFPGSFICDYCPKISNKNTSYETNSGEDSWLWVDNNNKNYEITCNEGWLAYQAQAYNTWDDKEIKVQIPEDFYLSSEEEISFFIKQLLIFL